MKNSEQVVAGEIPPCLQVESDISKAKKTSGNAPIEQLGYVPLVFVFLTHPCSVNQSKSLFFFFFYGGVGLFRRLVFGEEGGLVLTSSAYDCANKIPKSIPQIK